MSLHEKSAWTCLLSTLLVWGGYLAFVLRLAPEASGAALPALGAAIVLQTAVMVAAHVVFAIADRAGPGFDERDRAIAMRSGQWGGWILSVGVFACMVLFPMRELAMQMDPPGPLAGGSLASPFATANVLLLWLVLSEVVHYGAQVVLHRRG